MTKQASTHALAALPDAPPVPRAPSPALAHAMSLALVARPAGDPDGLTQQLAQDVAAEARRRLDGIQAAMQQRAEPETIRQWVIRVISLIGHPTDADQIAFKVAALTDLLGDVPRRCLTKRSAGEVARRFRFFPSAADLLATIQPEAEGLERERQRLRAVIARASPPPPRPVLTEAERAAMRQASAAYQRELAAIQAERAAREVAALPADAAARRAATSPDTPDDAVRTLAASAGPGATLARLRVAIAEARRPAAPTLPETRSPA